MHWHDVLCADIALDKTACIMQDAILVTHTFCDSDSNSGARSTDIQVASCALVLS